MIVIHGCSSKLAAILGLLMLVAVATPAAAQSSSASYVLKQSTTNGGGGSASSASYVLDASTGQETTIGASSAANSYVLQSGFWSFVGSGLVPVVLVVSRDGVTPGNIDLLWSGNNSPYTVYRSDDCTSVLASLFDTTGSNEYGDIAPLPSPLECFNVLATAPGPAPPRGGTP